MALPDSLQPIRPGRTCSFRGFFFVQKEGNITSKQENNNNFCAISLSGGKDSSALLLLMLEKDMPIDTVIYADTGMEFPEMEAHIAKLDNLLLRERGIHITTLCHPHGFEWLMFDEAKQKPSCLERRALMGIPPYGNGWPGAKVRWCTGQLKTHAGQCVLAAKPVYKDYVDRSYSLSIWSPFHKLSSWRRALSRYCMVFVPAIPCIQLSMYE